MLAVAQSGIVILSDESRDGLRILETRCSSFEEYKELPQIVSFEGQLFGLTGRNSDRNVAYYRSDARIALSAVA